MPKKSPNPERYPVPSRTDGLELPGSDASDVLHLRRVVDWTVRIPDQFLAEIDQRAAKHLEAVARGETNVPRERGWDRDDEISLTVASLRPGHAESDDEFPVDLVAAMWQALETDDTTAQDKLLTEWDWSQLQDLVGDQPGESANVSAARSPRTTARDRGLAAIDIARMRAVVLRYDLVSNFLWENRTGLGLTLSVPAKTAPLATTIVELIGESDLTVDWIRELIRTRDRSEARH